MKYSYHVYMIAVAIASSKDGYGSKKKSDNTGWANSGSLNANETWTMDILIDRRHTYKGTESLIETSLRSDKGINGLNSPQGRSHEWVKQREETDEN